MEGCISGKVALIFVFNHRFDKNIEALEKIYKNRFSCIYHLVPFYDGDKKNVIPVYENSFYFQGYLAQGFKQYFDEKYEHYFFLGDDLLLHPCINEDNYKEYFSILSNSSFIPEVFTLDNFTNTNTLRFVTYKSITNSKTKLHWWRIKDILKYRQQNEGIEYKKEMPSYDEAFRKITAHGYTIKSLTFHDVYGFFPTTFEKKDKRIQALRFLYRITKYYKKFRLPYPLVASYSDIVIVSKDSIKNFCHYCGMFAANNLFVECAIPTALLLASDKVVTEKDLGKRGQIYWLYTPAETAMYESDMKQYSYNLKKLLQHFPKDRLYIHPVKLSKWKMEMSSEDVRTNTHNGYAL